MRRPAATNATARPGRSAPFEWRLHPGRSNADLAYDRLRDAIVSGQFEPGQRITELGIGGLLGVSRTPVREAFMRLTVDGLLRPGSAGGVEIVAPQEESEDIHALRESVEGCAARLAAIRATREEVAAMSDLAEQTSRSDPAHLAARAQLNERFHLAVAEASHAPRVQRLVRDYRSLFSSAERLGRIRGTRTGRLLAAHLGIADAIARRDPELAEARMREHLRSVGTKGSFA